MLQSLTTLTAKLTSARPVHELLICVLANASFSTGQTMYDQVGARLGRSPKSVKVGSGHARVEHADRLRISQNMWLMRLKKEVEDVKASLG